MKKYFFVISLLLIFSAQAFSASKGEDEAKRIFIRNWGYTVLLDFCQNPVHRYTFDSGYGLDTAYYQDFGFALASVQFGFRCNLHKFSDDNALCLSANPSFAFGPWNADAEGLGMFNMPILLSYDAGAGSTYATVKDKGAFIGVGVELYKTPIIFLDRAFLSNGERKPSLWMEPVFSAGFRRWKSTVFSQTEHLREVGVKFGMGGRRPYSENGGLPEKETRSWSFRLYFSTFINY